MVCKSYGLLGGTALIIRFRVMLRKDKEAVGLTTIRSSLIGEGGNEVHKRDKVGARGPTSH